MVVVRPLKVGTIHYILPGSADKKKAACGMKHPKMSWTDERNKSTCPQCLDAARPQVPAKGQAFPKGPKQY